MLTDAAALRRLVFGALHTGSLLQLNNLRCLPTLLAIQVGEWLGAVFKALAKVPSFLASQAQHAAPGKGESDAAMVVAASSSHSTPAPPSQKEASWSFEPIPEQESSGTTVGIHRPSTFYSSQDPRSLSTPTASVISRQSFRPYPSQLSLQLTNLACTRSSSRSTVRLDWYQLLQEGRLGEVEPAVWFGYGGETRRTVEVDSSVQIPVSPAFGCILVGETSAKAILEELKVRTYNGTPSMWTLEIGRALFLVGVSLL